MTNWMWFVSGVIAGGLITGVSSFFIFKKKKDEMERKYTNMVNDFFRNSNDDFKKDMDDAVKSAKEVIDIYSGESDDMFDDNNYPDDEFEMFSSDDELTDEDVICYEKDDDYAGVPEDCYVDASTDIMIIDSSEYGEVSTYQMIQWEYNTEKDKMYDLKGREITDYTDYVGDAFKRIFKETDEDAVYIQNNTLKRYYEIAEDLS